MYKTCFLFGHADTPQSILPAIEDAVEKCYSIYGIQHFYVGNRGNFDKNGDFKSIGSSAVAYGWFVWEKGYKGDPAIKWFN